MNAIDDVEDSLTLVDRVRANFPDLPHHRARPQRLALLRAARLRGVQVVERETFESALQGRAGGPRGAGRGPLSAPRSLPTRFGGTISRSVDATLPFYQDEASRMNIAKAGREELEQQFARDRERFEREHGTGMEVNLREEP